ncbi:thioesterase family protein [Actinomadura viridis]|uniref:Acyl-coenzyme A thioesterase PaaI-like protein n=1 Tax=Actinomadura viridis TaxID=58110 RepID=A0A931DPE7_9ACTN|nr:thioesterase family protein [Actinomadura viridis]MBG6093670.1 acyl-coenzyme A thioesterase PaaI-like protein [Actinomadura viridis]
MSRFGDATAVERTAEGRYEADLDAGFSFAEAVNGGYLMAVLARAAVDASPHEHPVATAATFLRVAKPGRAEVLVETRKSGRTAATARVGLVQDGVPVVEALITTSTLDAGDEPDWVGEPPVPAVPPIEHCTSFGGVGDDRTRGFADQVDMRFDPATMGWLDGQPGGRPEMRAWFGLADPHEPDAYALALAVDALPPIVLNMGARGWAPTVEMTWHMRAVPAPGPLAVHGSGRLVTGGWFDEEVEVWDSAGRLVAQSRQLARVGRKS